MSIGAKYFLVGAEVGELEVDAEVGGLEFGDDLLEGVAVFGGDADGLALDGGVGLDFGVLDEGDDFFGGVGVDALLELDLLADGGVGGGLDFFVLEVLEGDADVSTAAELWGDGAELGSGRRRRSRFARYPTLSMKPNGWATQG